VCFTRPVYHTKNSVSKIYTQNSWQCGDENVTIMIQYRIFPRNSSPFEKNVDNFMLTWNYGITNIAWGKIFVYWVSSVGG